MKTEPSVSPAAATGSLEEIIAQFPANDAATAGQLFEGLLRLGGGALATLCGQLVPLGEGDDNPARYALTGLARYVTRPCCDGADRDLVEGALLEGLRSAKKPEVQAFLLRQLQQCGTNDSVTDIAGLLDNNAIASHAILALDAIDTWRARRALSKALRRTEGETQLQILSALADEGSDWRVTHAARARIEANPDANEYVLLLSILVKAAGDHAHKDLIGAMDREEPHIRKAALAYAAPMMDRYAEKMWRKKLRDPDLPDAVKREIGKLLAAPGSGE